MNLGDVNTVKHAVKLGVSEFGVGGFVEVGLNGREFVWESSIIGAGARICFLKIIGKLGGGAGKDSRKGIIDSA